MKAYVPKALLALVIASTLLLLAGCSVSVDDKKSI